MPATSTTTRSADERVVALDDDVPPGEFDLRRAYAEHGRVLFGFALNGVGDSGLAEDCVQETFLRAWRARDRYRSERASERTWLFSIARNVVVDALRTRSRRPAPVDTAGGGAHDELAGRRTEQQVEDRVVLIAGLARLSPEHREVIVAVQVEGLGYDQLSERTGVPVATLRTRMYYGLRSLRTIMREEESDG